MESWQEVQHTNTEVSRETIITIEQCRKILNDYKSSDDIINKRLQFLEAFCRNIIKSEIETYVKRQK